MLTIRKIIHIDMDCFYAAVEMRDNPAYRHIPLAVGGTGARSVLCTCNYIAREYGIRSAMSAIKAKQLCPNLTIVPGRMDVYREASQQIRAIFQQYTDTIEPLSLDEAYLDVTEATLCRGSATLIAEKIRQDIYQKTGLTASAGVAPNKFLAKIASDENKPNGQCVITPDKVAMFVENLPLKKIPGIGPKTTEKLKQHGYETCKDIRASNVKQLTLLVGKFAHNLYQRSFGKDERELQVNRQRKSLATEITLAEDIQTEEECLQVLEPLLDKLAVRLTNHSHRKIIRQGIKLKFADFNQTTVEQQSLYCDKTVFTQLLVKAMARSNNRRIRLIGITIGFAEEQSVSQQLPLPIV